MLKRAPAPGALSTVMAPSWARTIPADAQPEAGAAALLRGEERIEDTLLMLGHDPAPGIRNGERDARAAIPHGGRPADLHAAPSRRRRQGVGEEVQQDLDQPIRVRGDHREACRDRQNELDGACDVLGSDDAGHIAHQLAEVHGLATSRDGAGRLQDMLHRARDASDLLPDGLHIALSRVALGQTPAEMAGSSGDYVERSAHLVGDDAGQLADGGQTLRVPVLTLEDGSVLLGLASLLLRLIEPADHAVEGPCQLSHFRVTPRGDPGLQIPAPDLFHAGDEAPDRPGDEQGDPDPERHAHGHQHQRALDQDTVPELLERACDSRGIEDQLENALRRVIGGQRQLDVVGARKAPPRRDGLRHRLRSDLGRADVGSPVRGSRLESRPDSMPLQAVDANAFGVLGLPDVLEQCDQPEVIRGTQEGRDLPLDRLRHEARLALELGKHPSALLPEPPGVRRHGDGHDGPGEEQEEAEPDALRG
jgi:hypothetical protein